jgi:transcription initiation factor TFIIH subunit 3
MLKDTTSSFLQQASDITSGVYVNTRDDRVVQSLIHSFIPSVEMRGVMGVGQGGDVDFRPICFCHRKVVATGYVCSVCLSIFCYESKVCEMCKTVFSET